jgi:hypothetical protein
MTDPIISYDGGGELQTHKDASSILERYYFKEKESEGRVYVREEDAQEKEPEENEIVTGEEADSIQKTMDELEDELTEDFMLEDDAEGGEVPGEAKVPKEFEKNDGGEPEGVAKDVTESMEQSVIEKLISEMEEAGPDKPIEPEKDEETEEAGTDKAGEKEVDKILEDLELEIAMMEADEEVAKDEKEGDEDKEDEKEGDEDKDLDVDAGVKKESYGLGPIVPSSDKDRVEEAFRLFKEQIDEEEKGEKEEEKGEKEEKEGEAEEEKGEKEEKAGEKEEEKGEKEEKKGEKGIEEDFMFEDVDEDDEKD